MALRERARDSHDAAIGRGDASPTGPPKIFLVPGFVRGADDADRAMGDPPNQLAKPVSCIDRITVLRDSTRIPLIGRTSQH